MGKNKTTNLVDELGARTNQTIASQEQDPIVPRLFAPMNDRLQHSGAHATQTGQQLRIHFVGLRIVLGNQSHSPWIRDDHFVARLLDQAAYPRRVSPDFQNHSTGFESSHRPTQRHHRRGHAESLFDLPRRN